MGSIPLVANQPQDVVPMPRTPLEAYARAVSLQGMIADNQAVQQQTDQRAQAFPVAQQQAQANVQATQQENAVREQQMKDAQLLRGLQSQYVTRDSNGKVSGFDYDGFFQGATAAGASPQAVSSLAAAHAETVTKLAGADKSVRDAEESRYKKLYDLAEGYKAIKDPAQRQQAWVNILPQLARQKVDITQFPVRAPSDDDVNSLEASFGQHAQVLADAKTVAETNKANRGDQFDQEFAAYMKNPTLDRGIAKDAATFTSWKAKQSPTAMVMGNMLGQPGAGSALDQSAQRYLQTGELPSGFGRSPGTTAAIVKRAAELDPNANVAGNKATFKADSAALTTLTKQFESVSAFEATAIKNLDRLAQTAKTIPDLGARFANIPLRKITGQMIGTEPMARLNADMLTARTEAARVLNSANASGVLSDNARHETEQILNGDMTYPAMMGAIDELKNDMGNRHKSYKDDIDALQTKLRGTSTQPNSGGKTYKVGDVITQNGHKYKVSAVDASGKATGADPI